MMRGPLALGDIANIYSRTHEGWFRTQPVDDILDWAEERTDIFYVDEHGYFYLKGGAICKG